MKRLFFGEPLPGPNGFQTWVRNALDDIDRASVEDIQALLTEYKITGALTETRTLNAATATATDLRNFIATLVSDIQKGGQKRGYAS